MTADPQWVTQSEAARRETAAGRAVTQSSISRFLEANPDVPVERGPNGRVRRVDYQALVAARMGSLSVLDKLAERQAAAPLLEQPARPAAPSNRKRELEEEKLELDLAERKGEVVDRAAVLMAVESAGLAFVQALERRRRGLAQQLEGVTDVRAIELALKAADRVLLEDLSKALAGAAEGLTAAPAEGDEGPTEPALAA